jgi:RNA ligase
MKKHISFPSIEQFRHIIATVNRKAEYIGLDETGEAIFDPSRLKPVLTFKGTVKLHGTNFSVCYNNTDKMWTQSRENIITPEKDNAGAAFFVENNKTSFLILFNQVAQKYGIDLNENTISIYGEWVGRGIQKAVAISELDKSVFIFAVKVSPHPKNEDDKPVAYWVDSSFLRDPEHKIYNIEDYKTYSIDIDFNNPQLSQNEIIEMTIEVEDECPVGKAFGVTGIGEGIVFLHMTSSGECLRFKSKGEKHSKASKVKTLKPVDDEKLNQVITIANQVCVGWRLEQMLDKTFDLINGGTIDIKQMGVFIKNVINDILKEESDVIAAAGLEPKDLNSKISEISRNYLITKLNEKAGLK